MIVWIVLAAMGLSVLWIVSLLRDILNVLTETRNDQFHRYKDLSNVLREIESICDMTLREVEKLTPPPDIDHGPFGP